MTDAEFEAQKARLRSIAEKWAEALGLNKLWTIDIHYERAPHRTMASEEEAGDNWQRNFVVHARWTHLKAAIYVNTPALEDLSDEELEKSFVHELCHIFLNETRQKDEDWLDHEERVATILANAFIWLRDAVQKEAEAMTESSAGGE